MNGHRIVVSDEVYEHLKGIIEDEHVSNGDMSEERNESGETIAHRPTFSEVIEHMIQDKEDNEKRISALEADAKKQKVIREAFERAYKSASEASKKDLTAKMRLEVVATQQGDRIKKLEEEVKKFTERSKYWMEQHQTLRNDLPTSYKIGDFNKLENALKEATEKAKNAPLFGTRSEDLEYEETHGR